MGTDTIVLGRAETLPDEPQVAVRAPQQVDMRFYRSGDQAQILSLHRRVMNTPWDERLWRWLYFDNPDGEATIVVAEDADRIVAHFAFFPLRMWRGEDAILGSKSVQAMVDPAYQGRGLFTRITKFLLEQAKTAGIAFTYSCPNRNSYHALVNKVGYRNVCGARTGQYAGDRGVSVFCRPLPGADRPARGDWKAGLVRAGATAGSWAARWVLTRPGGNGHAAVQVAQTDHFDDRFDELWDASRARLGLAKVRDSAFLRWRYSDRPERQYDILTAEAEGRLLGYMVVGAYELRGWKVGAVIDFLVLPGARHAFRALALAALDGCQQERSVACCIATTRSDEEHWLRELGFRQIPDRLAPRKFFFVVHPNTEEFRRDLVDGRQQWYITFGDSEVY